MNQRPDPDKTREIRTPQQRPGHRPETPWWQNVNRQVPPIPPPPTRPHPTPLPRGPARPPQERPIPAPPPPAPAPRRPSPPPQPRTVGSATQEPKPRPRRKLLIRAGIAAIAVEAVILAVVLSRLQHSDAKVLDVNGAQRGVAQVLMDPVDGYGAQSVTGIVCNNGTNPAVRKGVTFSCEAVVDGTSRQVAVVFQDDEGTYAVDRPR